jgi:hypothetical protein
LFAEIHFVDFINIREHVTNLVITLMDMFLCAHPLRLMHVYQPVLLGIGYSAFSGLYYVLGGKNRLGFDYIYPILDWNNPGRALTITAITATFALFLYFVMWCLYMLRVTIATRVFKTVSVSKESSDTKITV